VSNQRIGVFCNAGIHAGEVVAAVLARFPDADVYALVPPGSFLKKRFGTSMVNVVEMERERYSLREPGVCWRLVRRLRRERFERFIVLFDSLQLGLLGGIIGAQTVECWDDAKVIHRLPRTVPGVLVRLLGRRIWGLTRWARIEIPSRLRGRPQPDYRKNGPKEDEFLV